MQKFRLNILYGLAFLTVITLPLGAKASVCFVTDTSECGGNLGSTEDTFGNEGALPDYNLDDAERCKKEGYTLTSCANGGIPEGFCIYDSNFFKNCRCPTGYKTCEPPYYGVGQTCGRKYESCEEDIERACKELNPDYTNTCESGWQINPNDQCKYDETFGTCCNQCIGYDYTDIPEGYVQDDEACTDCNGKTKYKVKPNPCDGFMDCGSMGGAVGAETCLSGDTIKYDNCKPCPNLGTLTSCPSCSVCSYEECSGLWYVTGCQNGCTDYCDFCAM